MTQAKLTNVRIAFPDLYTPTQYKGTGPFHYRATFLFEPQSQAHKDIEAAIATVAKDKWGAKAKSVLDSIRGQSQKFCLGDGNMKEYDGFAGMFFLSASRPADNGRPLVIDRDKTPLLATDGKPYGGCMVNAIVDIWAQDNDWGKGVRAMLLGVQFAADAPAFGAVAPPARPDAFDVVAAANDDDYGVL